MRAHRGLQGESYLDVQPAILLVPTSLKTAAEKLLSSIWDPAGANQQTMNPFANKLQLVVGPRFDADSTTAWYVMCNPNQFTWFTRIYLEGQTAPHVEEKARRDIDGIEIKVRHDFAAASRLWKGVVRNEDAQVERIPYDTE